MKPMNNMSPRNIGGICLGLLGGYGFMTLSRGEKIHQREWTSLPMPEDVINRVHKLEITSLIEITF
jgi:hypothetical protein